MVILVAPASTDRRIVVPDAIGFCELEDVILGVAHRLAIRATGFAYWTSLAISLFFFQAEDGIRDWSVTGVQTCALPIFRCSQPCRSGSRPGKATRRTPTGARRRS